MECTFKKHCSFVLVIWLVFLSSLVCCQLRHDFYGATCPQLTLIVRELLWHTMMFEDERIPASLLRLHFHDCFANGCDGSVLLDDTSTLRGEKNASPNRNSTRGFEFIDKIKLQVEIACPNTVSCADLLALAAREAVNLLSWWPTISIPALLGRRDGTTASKTEAELLPSPIETLENIMNKFNSKGLNIKDMVVLSGAHTTGYAKCIRFKQRLYNFNGTGKPDPSMDVSLVLRLQKICPADSSFDNNLAPLDIVTPLAFDNFYYKNLEVNSGILQTDQALMHDKRTTSLVTMYKDNPYQFYTDFTASLEKMSRIGVLTGQQGQIRKKCRFVNKNN